MYRICISAAILTVTPHLAFADCVSEAIAYIQNADKTIVSSAAAQSDAEISAAALQRCLNRYLEGISSSTEGEASSIRTDSSSSATSWPFPTQEQMAPSPQFGDDQLSIPGINSSEASQ